jgi:hypothetical protein
LISPRQASVGCGVFTAAAVPQRGSRGLG